MTTAASEEGGTLGDTDTVPFSVDVTDEQLECADSLAARMKLKASAWKTIKPGVNEAPEATKLFAKLGTPS